MLLRATSQRWYHHDGALTAVNSEGATAADLQTKHKALQVSKSLLLQQAVPQKRVVEA
jgi:hypothetical protein